MARKRSRAAGDERAAAGDEQAGDERAAAGDEQAGDERAAAGDEQAGDERAAAELYQRLLETPGDVVAQMMSGCLEQLLDTFGIKRPTAGNEQEANAMRAELEKLDMPTVCIVFENKTGYRFLGFTHGTTTTAQSERYSGFIKDWDLQPEDG